MTLLLRHVSAGMLHIIDILCDKSNFSHWGTVMRKDIWLDFIDVWPIQSVMFHLPPSKIFEFSPDLYCFLKMS